MIPGRNRCDTDRLPLALLLVVGPWMSRRVNTEPVNDDGWVAAARGASSAASAVTGKVKEPLSAVTVVPWALLGLCAILLISDNPQVGYLRAEIALAALTLAFGVWLFWHHGGRQVTAAGLVGAAAAVFIGFPGLWWVDRLGSAIAAEYFYATAICYYSLLTMWVLFWRSTASGPDLAHLPTATPAARWSVGTGLVLVLLATGTAALTGSASSVYHGSVAFAGTALVSVGITGGFLTSTQNGRLRPAAYALIGFSLLAYLGTIFGGYGRLTFVALVLGPVVALCLRLPRRTLKAVTLLGTPVMAVILTKLRLGVVAEQYGSAAARTDGPDSTVTPLKTLALLLRNLDQLSPGDGSVLWASFTIFVPRAMWEDKPQGFGTVLTGRFAPELLPTGHTMVALMPGEWLYDFGLPGLVGMVLLLGWGLRRLDLGLARALAGDLGSRRGLWVLAVLVTLVAGLPDLVWGGTSTYVSRSLFRLVPLVVVLIVASRGQTHTQTPASQAPSVVKG